MNNNRKKIINKFEKFQRFAFATKINMAFIRDPVNFLHIFIFCGCCSSIFVGGNDDDDDNNNNERTISPLSAKREKDWEFKSVRWKIATE